MAELRWTTNNEYNGRARVSVSPSNKYSEFLLNEEVNLLQLLHKTVNVTNNKYKSKGIHLETVFCLTSYVNMYNMYYLSSSTLKQPKSRFTIVRFQPSRYPVSPFPFLIRRQLDVRLVTPSFHLNRPSSP